MVGAIQVRIPSLSPRRSRSGAASALPSPVQVAGQPLAAVQARDHDGRILKRANEVEFHFCRGGPRLGRHTYTSFPRTGSHQPVDQRFRVARGGRKADPLELSPCQPGNPFQEGEQVPPTVVAGKGVDFVDDDHPEIAEQVVPRTLLPGAPRQREGTRRTVAELRYSPTLKPVRRTSDIICAIVNTNVTQGLSQDARVGGFADTMSNRLVGALSRQ